MVTSTKPSAGMASEGAMQDSPQTRRLIVVMLLTSFVTVAWILTATSCDYWPGEDCNRGNPCTCSDGGSGTLQCEGTSFKLMCECNGTARTTGVIDAGADADATDVPAGDGSRDGSTDKPFARHGF
jgi:hypothetical protein